MISHQTLQSIFKLRSLLGSGSTSIGRFTAIVVLTVAIATPCLVSSSTALAASLAPRWVISSVAQPTNFSAEDTVLCKRSEFFLCDQYVVTLTNVGSGSTTAPVVIADTLPEGLRAVGMGGYNMAENLELERLSTQST